VVDQDTACNLGTAVSSFWILANDSRVQIAVGREVVDGNIIPRLVAQLL
jgi:hypothetical protein